MCNAWFAILPYRLGLGVTVRACSHSTHQRYCHRIVGYNNVNVDTAIAEMPSKSFEIKLN